MGRTINRVDWTLNTDCPDANVSQERNSVHTEIAIARKKNELFEEKEQIAASEKQIVNITQEADELAVRAENNNRIQLLSESNVKRKRVDCLKIDLAAIKSEVHRLEAELDSK